MLSGEKQKFSRGGNANYHQVSSLFDQNQHSYFGSKNLLHSFYQLFGCIFVGYVGLYFIVFSLLPTGTPSNLCDEDPVIRGS